MDRNRNDRRQPLWLSTVGVPVRRGREPGTREAVWKESRRTQAVRESARVRALLAAAAITAAVVVGACSDEPGPCGGRDEVACDGNLVVEYRACEESTRVLESCDVDRGEICAEESAGGAACRCALPRYLACSGGDVHWIDPCEGAAVLADDCSEAGPCDPTGSPHCVCSSRVDQGCADGEIYWFDSCGNPDGMFDNCGGGSECAQEADGLSCMCLGVLQRGCSGSEVHWFDSCGHEQGLASACAESDACLDGLCMPPEEVPGYLAESEWVRVRRIQLPVRQAPCCADLDDGSPSGDLEVDNAMGQVIVGMGPLLGSAGSPQDVLDRAVDIGQISLVFRFRGIPPDFSRDGPISVGLYDAVPVPDGSGDETPPDETESGGSFRFLLGGGPFASGGTVGEFGAGWYDGNAVDAWQGRISVAIPLWEGEVLPVSISLARLEAELVRDAWGGLFSLDTEVDVEGDLLGLGGAKLSGTISLADLIAGFDTVARTCGDCGGFDPDAPVFRFAENVDAGSFDIACEQDVSGTSDCGQDDPVICEYLRSVCGVASIVGSLADVDTNDNDVNDSLSLGLYLTFGPATFAGVMR